MAWLGRSFSRGRFGRRILAVFVSCSLLPIGVLALISYRQVTGQLRAQGQARVQQAAKNIGMSIYERLLDLRAEMELAARTLPIDAMIPRNFGHSIGNKFKVVELVLDDGPIIPVYGNAVPAPPPDSPGQDHLAAGRTLMTVTMDGDRVQVLLQRMLHPGQPQAGRLLAAVNPEFLWAPAGAKVLPPMTEVAVLDANGRVLFASSGTGEVQPGHLHQQVNSSHSGAFSWKTAGETYLAAFWTLFLKYEFATPGWKIVVGEAESQVFAPVNRFSRTFPLVALLTLWVVLLLSINLIRRTTQPLAELQRGAEAFGHGDLATRVEVDSGDEFHDVATAFNNMAAQLQRQFQAMRTMNDIDRAILASLDTSTVVETVLTRANSLLGCSRAGFLFRRPEDDGKGELVFAPDSTAPRLQKMQVRLGREMLAGGYATWREVSSAAEVPGCLAPLVGTEAAILMVLPIAVGDEVVAWMALAYHSGEQTDEGRRYARQLADQVGVALANARLVRELENLSWGALATLARAIDAKSPWTRGHSERVTELAVALGAAMGLSPAEQDILRRGGLLHDIGKIGIPPHVLDKRGRLDTAEYQVMQRHPEIGARILEPMACFKEVIPIVAQHHEYFDGSGYPRGLKGEEIDLYARIFTVADHFEAMYADRPYRRGMEPEEIMKLLTGKLRPKFDPEVLAALERMVASGWRPGASEHGKRQEIQEDGI